MNTKARDEIEVQSNVIYEIPCQENCCQKYYGCSEQCVKRRVYQHEYSYDKIETNKHDPAALKHARVHGHTSVSYAHLDVYKRQV